jgi:hypothetical protein
VKFAFERWEPEVWSILTPLMAALNVADRVTMGPEVVPAISDQFRALSKDVASWIQAHTCPVPDLAVLLTRLVLSSGTAGWRVRCPSRRARERSIPQSRVSTVH